MSTSRYSVPHELGLLKAALIWLAVAAIALALFFGCSKTENKPPLSTTGTLTAQQIRGALGLTYCGDDTYAIVNSASLQSLYDDFRAELFRRGVTKWDDRFDCNHFAGYFVDLAQTQFYFASFQSRTTAKTLAMGPFWYQSARGPHAIVVIFTERGKLFLEPQTGALLTLTPAEEQSAWLKVF